MIARVYIIRVTDHVVKIGYSTNPIRRATQLRCDWKHPEAWVVWMGEPDERAAFIERRAHEILAACRIGMSEEFTVSRRRAIAAVMEATRHVRGSPEAADAIDLAREGGSENAARKAARARRALAELGVRREARAGTGAQGQAFGPGARAMAARGLDNGADRSGNRRVRKHAASETWTARNAALRESER